MARGLFLIFSLFALQVVAREIDPSYYIYPLEDVERLYSGNFGEFRRDHLHSGVDIKTDGVEGKRIVATASGYVSRVGHSPAGYGLALYVTHPNGTTSVYAHLSSFRSDIAKRIEQERYSRRQNAVNIELASDEFPVQQGEFIGLSGNTGSSFGPHLHYEIRETDSQKPINIFARKIIKPRDARPPIFFKLHYIETDSVDGVVYRAPIRTYELDNISTGQYRLNTPDNTIEVGRSGYFVVETGDRKDEVTNRFGVYRLEGFVDSEPYFSYHMDSFLFGHTRYVNSLSHYSINRASRNEVISMAHLECGTSHFYDIIENRGIIGCSDGQGADIEIIATDDVGLQATLKFSILGGRQPFKAKPDSTLQIVRATKRFEYKEGGVAVKIPPRALYESTPFMCQMLESEIADTTLLPISPTYKILDDSIPLHLAMCISIDVDMCHSLVSHVAVAKMGKDGAVEYVGGSYDAGAVGVSSRSAGEFLVVVDTLPPTIEPLFEMGANLSQQRGVAFRVVDNFSEIKSYTAHINGEWSALELHKDSITHIFTGSALNKEHAIVVEVEDGCGNMAVVEQKYWR